MTCSRTVRIGNSLRRHTGDFGLNVENCRPRRPTRNACRRMKRDQGGVR